MNTKLAFSLLAAALVAAVRATGYEAELPAATASAIEQTTHRDADQQHEFVVLRRKAGFALAAGPESRSPGTSVLRHLDPALPHRVNDCLGAVVHGQLPQDRAHVVLDGLLGDR